MTALISVFFVALAKDLLRSGAAFRRLPEV